MSQTPTTSLAALMKANQQLRAAAQTAKKVVAQRDFTGPPGDYVCKFRGTTLTVKNGATWYVLRFAVDGSVDGQGEWNGASMDIVHGLFDDERSSAGEKLSRLFVDIQRLGIDTATASMEQIDAALQALVNSPIRMRVVQNPNPGKRNYINITGLAEAGRSEPDYSQEPQQEPAAAAPQPARRGRKAKAAVDPAPTPAPAPVEDNWDSPAEDEWNDELAADATAEAESAPSWNPSDWIDFEVEYKPKNAPKPLTFKVIAADDEVRTVTLERGGRTIKAQFDDLILPE